MTTRPDPQRREWDDMGRMDALWAILSEPSKRYGRWDVDEFLATGRDEIDGVLATARRWGLPGRMDRALDFGCGVGRLTRAMAAHFSTTVGVDISEVMVARARALHADEPGCAFEVIPDQGLTSWPDRSFDFLYSRIVLQHIPDVRVTKARIRELLRLLATDGLLVFQVPAAIPLRRRVQARPRLYAFLRRLGVSEAFLYRRFGLHPIRMRAVPEAEVVSLITADGARILDIQRIRADATGIQDRVYWATRPR
jgi:SAM-dependent methyltransferase